MTDGGEIPTTADPDAKKWRVVALLESGKPKHLGKIYDCEKAEELRDAHLSALNGDKTSPVQPPRNTTEIRIMTSEEHEAKRISWVMEKKEVSNRG